MTRKVYLLASALLSFLFFVGLGLFKGSSDVYAQTCSGKVKIITECAWVQTMAGGPSCGQTGGPGCSCQQVSNAYYPCSWNGSQCMAKIEDVICGVDTDRKCRLFYGDGIKDIACGAPSSVTPTPTSTSTCTTTCEKVTECNLKDNCSGGTQGSFCGIHKPTGKSKYWCTWRRCTTVCPTPTSTPIPTATPTPVVESAQCRDVKIYSKDWMLLTPTQISALKAGDVVELCVTGVVNSGVGYFDMARFTVNNSLLGITSAGRQGGSRGEFCLAYGIPAGVYNFNVVADLHHTVLGWIR